MPASETTRPFASEVMEVRSGVDSRGSIVAQRTAGIVNFSVIWLRIFMVFPAPKPSFSNSGYEFLRAGGERSFASIKIPGSRCGATVAASACWREGGSS
jgi:hypothetical protein